MAQRALLSRRGARTKTSCSRRPKPAKAAETFPEALLFEDMLIQGSYLREWSEWLEQPGRSTGASRHPEDEFAEFIEECRILADAAGPSRVRRLEFPLPEEDRRSREGPPFRGPSEGSGAHDGSPADCAERSPSDSAEDFVTEVISE